MHDTHDDQRTGGAANGAANAKPPLWTPAFIQITLSNFFMFFGFSMLPSLLPLHFRDLGAPEPVIGFVAGVYTLASLLMRPIVGVVVDRVGRKGVLGLGLVIMCFASLAYAVFPFVSLVLVFRFIQGLGWAMSNTSAPTLVADIMPQKRFAEGMAWFTTGNSLSSVLAPGFSLAVYYSVGAEVSAVVSACFFALSFVLSRLLKVLEPSVPLAQVAHGGEPDGASKKPFSFSLGTLIERRSVLPACIMLFATACFGTITSFVPVMMEARGIEGVVWFFPIQATAILITRPQLGKFVDAHGYRTAAVLGMGLMCAGMLVLSQAQVFWVIAAGALLTGMGYATCYATFQTMAVAGIEKERRGSATATFYLGFDTGMGVGAICAGLVAGGVGYTWMFGIFALLPLVGLAVLFANADKVKSRERDRV